MHSFSNMGEITWKERINRIILARTRFNGVLIENLDALTLIEKYDSDKTLFYCDPPYIFSARRDKKLYEYELEDDAHVKLLEKLINVRGFVIISGYRSQLYDTYLKDFFVKDFDVKISIATKGNFDKTRVERVWLNNKFNFKNNIVKNFW